MTDNNDMLNENQLAMVAGGTEENEKLSQAATRLGDCKSFTDAFCSHGTTQFLPDAQNLKKYVARAYKDARYGDYKDCIEKINAALWALKRVHTLVPVAAKFELDSIKRLLLEAEDILK